MVHAQRAVEVLLGPDSQGRSYHMKRRAHTLSRKPRKKGGATRFMAASKCGGAGDPSLRLKNGSGQDDAIRFGGLV